MGKLKKMIKDKKGMSYPLTVALVLALLIDTFKSVTRYSYPFSCHFT